MSGRWAKAWAVWAGRKGQAEQYLAVKKTFRITEVGGALNGRASSIPLLGETLKTPWSVLFFCMAAGRGRGLEVSQQFCGLPKTTPACTEAEQAGESPRARGGTL